MKSKKMVNCKNCGEEIAAVAQICPKCGVKVKKPFYKRGWFIALCVVVVIVAAASSGGEDSTPTGDLSGSASVSSAAPVEQEIVYTACTVDEMVDMLEGNAMKAENTYDDQYVEVEGRLDVIDSDGKYISLYPMKQQFALTGVQCFLKTDEQKQQVMELSKGERVTVRGKVTSVGELLGYQMNVIEFVK